LSQILTLAVVAVGIGWLFNHFGLDGMLSIALVAAGLGFVIFIHELGHFLVAKWCDVHVETFSIGFGPAIPGCSFQRGETLYKIAWFPLGGYVKMVGEGTETEEDDDDPRSFKNKTVGQRMAIISAGVIMNVLLGFACFIFVYMAHGVERPPAEVALVDAGKPAWQQGIPTGAIIRRIGSIENPYFDDLKPEVAFSAKGEKLPFVYELYDQPGELIETSIEPRRSDKDLNPLIGILSPNSLKLLPKDRRITLPPVLPTGAAAAADPPFELGDIVVGTTDPDHPKEVKPVSIIYDFEKRLMRLAGQPMIIQVRRHGAEPDAPPVNIHVPPAYHYVFGMRMRMGPVLAVRQQSPAEKAGVRPLDPERGSEGDLLDRVEVVENDGTKTRYVVKDLDPLRLPHELEQWAARKKGDKKVTLVVLRTVDHAERQEVPLELTWDDRWKFDKEMPWSELSPMPIPGLGLAYRIDTVVEAVDSKLPDGRTESPAFQAGLKRGDVIKAIRFQEQEPGKGPGQKKPGKWNELAAGEWAHVFNLLQNRFYKDVTLRVERDGETKEYELTGVPDTTWPLADRGLILITDLRLQQAENPWQAVKLGMNRTYGMIRMIYQNLVAMITGRVSTKTVGGPILIATEAYARASQDVYSLIFFLAVISVNLAVINFLPIPILDGGHMVFLIWEKVRGVPASETVRNAATIAGLALILLLVVFTFWLDISRFF
jgi:regulator of sigma E protease